MKFRSTKTKIGAIALLLLVFGGVLLVGAGVNRALEIPVPLSSAAEIASDSTSGLNIANKQPDQLPVRPGGIALPKPEPVNDLLQIVNDTTQQLNILDPKHPDFGKIPLPRRERLPNERLPNITPGTGDYGTRVDRSLTGVLGVYAGQEVQPSLTLPSAPPDRTLYAPTLEAPNYAPLESVTAYWRYAGMGSTSRGWGVWDHTTGGWAVFKPMDSTFLSNYVRSYPEGQLYFTEVVYTSSAWRVLLYNFNTGAWEQQYSSTGSSSRVDGWDAWESYFGGTCPSVPNVESKELKVFVNGQWPYVTSTYGSLLDYQNCAYAENMVSQYYHWSVGP